MLATIWAMSCPLCGSENLSEFGSEIAIHFPGLKDLKKPHVYLCTKLVVCLDCGKAQLEVPEAQRRLLTEPGVGGDQPTVFKANL